MRKLFSGLVLLNIGLLAGLFVRDADAFAGKLDRREDPIWNRRVLLASRNASGTMSAVNGPYISGTTISSSVINNRYADIEAEITDSLSRSGKGGMTAVLKGVDGTVAAPAYSFTSEPGTGLYRIGATDLGLAVNGVKQEEWTTSAQTIVQPLTLNSTLGVTGLLTATGRIQNANGAVGTPSYSFVNDTTSGLYRAGSLDLRFALNSADALRITTSGVGLTGAPTAINSAPVLAASGVSNHGYVVADTDSHTTKEAGFVLANAGVLKWEIYNPANSTDLRIFSNGSDRMTLTNGGALSVPGTVATGALTIGASGTAIAAASWGTCTLNNGTPSQCTITVASGAKCVCSSNNLANSCAVSVSATTATVQSGNTNTATVTAICVQ